MMSKATNKPTRRLPHSQVQYVLVGLNKSQRDHFGSSQTLPCSDVRTIRSAVEESSGNWTWFCRGKKLTETLLNEVSSFQRRNHGRRNRLGGLLMLDSPRAELIPSMRGFFDKVIGETSSLTFLPLDQLASVLSSADKADRFIGGVMDININMLALVRGNLEWLTVPLSIFPPSGVSHPDFHNFSLNDYGQTLQFGDYEATSDVVLYEFDLEYRRSLRARRRDKDQGFGPSLRRLRVQRGLSRSDFPGVSAKAIARIERGNVRKPREKTVSVIANTLNVLPDDIETY